MEAPLTEADENASVVPIAWGSTDYVASADAATALAATRRAGAPAVFDDLKAAAILVADGLFALQFRTWDFGDSVAFEALVEASEYFGDERWARFVQGWARSWATRALPFARLDCTAPGRAMVQVAEQFNDPELMSACTHLADFLMSRRLLFGAYETWQSAPLLFPYGGAGLDADGLELLESSPACICVDCLHFDAPFLVTLGRVTGEEKYLTAGLEQALAYIQALQMPDGLFDHFRLGGQESSFGPGWGRGQGWAILGLVDVLEELSLLQKLDSSAAAELAEATCKLIRRMCALQRPDGHWNAVVTDPHSGNEYSTAGFMASGFARAARLGIVDSDEVKEALRRACSAITQSLDSKGQLREVSAAVYASTEPTHYAHVPRGYVVPWGQGPALLALLECLRTREKSS